LLNLIFIFLCYTFPQMVLPALELVAIAVEIVHLRQAGIPRTVVETQLVQTRRLPRHAARRLVGQVEQELQTINRRMGLPLALSAESLHSDCIEVQHKGSKERN
jgi:hypothetical protein